MSQLRIFSYLPNPRIWKATIAARLCGVEVEVRGASPLELSGWLWDFDARELLEDEKDHAGGSERLAQTAFSGRLPRKPTRQRFGPASHLAEPTSASFTTRERGCGCSAALAQRNPIVPRA